MALGSARDLFIHELSDTMSAENIIAKLLPTMRQEATNPQLKEGFTRHLAETRHQILNLQQVFAELGAQPEETTCHAAEGLKQEHDALVEENPPAEVLDIGLLGGALKTEHYEIASYTALIGMANDLHEAKVAALLRENLRQEESMAMQLELLAKRLGEVAKMAVPV